MNTAETPVETETTVSDATARNATGPTTPEGKATSSRNAVKHGLCSRRLTGEDQEEYIAILESLHNEWEPQLETEYRLLDHMALNQWRMDRALSLELSALDDDHIDPAMLALALRYRVTAERAFYRALRELQALRRNTRAEAAAIDRDNQKKLEQELDRLIMSPIRVTPPPPSLNPFLSQNAVRPPSQPQALAPPKPGDFVSQNQPSAPEPGQRTAPSPHEKAA